MPSSNTTFLWSPQPPPISTGAVKASFDQALNLHRAGKLGDAERIYRSILAVDPRHADSLHLLGVIAAQTSHLEVAVEMIGRAISIRDNVAAYYSNYASVLHLLDRPDAAIAAYRQSLVLAPSAPDALSGLGLTLQLQGSYGEALECYAHALTSSPKHSDVRLNLATLQLLQGDFENGLRNYEWRWGSTTIRAARRDFAQPVWRGEQLRGARILLHAEQGFGDSLQFLRYLPQVRAAGGRVVLELQEPLCRLAAQLPGIEELVPAGHRLPDFDRHCPLMSLPLACQTKLATIPAETSYLTVPEEELRKAASFHWPKNGLRIGLVWAGSPTHRRDRHRSMPLPLIDTILRMNGVHYFSLQVGEASRQIEASPRVAPLPLDGDFATTAAYIAQLDLVITVDTAVAHLAGALGKPVWVMLPYVPDWRWLLDREDSPWYPTVRLFRQPSADDWISVLTQVRARLEKLVRVGNTVG
jgi:Tfp pilus assembly protein PilF